MNGLRQDVIDAMVKHFEDQRGHPPEQMQIEDLTDYADAALRVLAEHGDTQQVREQLVSSGALVLPRGDRLSAVMAVLAPIVERVERAEQSRDKLRASGEQHLTDLMTIADKNLARAERAEADLAAARMQVRVRDARLNQVRTLPTRSSSGMVRDYVYQRDLLAILDAPARPAGHDETGQ